jgi:hypothetical protein
MLRSSASRYARTLLSVREAEADARERADERDREPARDVPREVDFRVVVDVFRVFRFAPLRAPAPLLDRPVCAIALSSFDEKPAASRDYVTAIRSKASSAGTMPRLSWPATS